ncbi:MAG: acyltransferase family protein, partial [Beijerinckiaceae bacterium]
ARTTGVAASFAVGLFFVISGFLIAQSIRSRIGHTGFDAAGFAAARARRILPPFLFALLVTIVAVGFIHALGLYGSDAYRLPGDAESFRGRASITLREILWTLTLSYNLLPGYGQMVSFNGPLWSLSFEVWLYAAAGFWATGQYNRRWGGMVAALAIVAVPTVMDNRLFTIFAAIWLSAFAFGMGWGRARPRSFGRVAPLLAAVCLMASILMATASPGYRALLFAPYGLLAANMLYVGHIAVVSVLVMGWALQPDPEVAKRGSAHEVLDQRSRDFSYTLYVTHFPLMGLGYSLLRPQLDPASIAAMTGLGLVLLAGVLAFAWLTGPLIEGLGRRASSTSVLNSEAK